MHLNDTLKEILNIRHNARTVFIIQGQNRVVEMFKWIIFICP